MAVAELAIVKGLPRAFADTSSYENLEYINLLDPKGFSIQDKGWIPRLGQVKNGGLYAEAVGYGNDALLSASLGRTVETMNLTATGAVANSRAFLEKRLILFGYWAREFYTSDWQTEPVYLRWKGIGAKGYQYAMIFDIAIAQNTDPFHAINANQLTITITREPGWNWHVPPGSSPKIWTIFKRGITESLAQYHLTTGTNYFSGMIGAANVNLLNAGVESVGYKSYVDIPASDIPGDQPALLQLNLPGAMFKNGSATYQPYVATVHIARSTRQDYGYIPNNRFPAKCAVGAGATMTASAGLDVTYQTDYGAIDHYAPGAGSYYSAATYHNRARCTFITLGTIFNPRISWSAKMAPLAGRYAVFMRGHQSGGNFGDIELYLQYGYEGIELTTPIKNPVVQAVATHTEFWPVNYLGIITLPPGAPRIPIGVDGLGINQDAWLNIILWVRRKSGTSEFYFADLVLMPVDECFVTVTLENYLGTTGLTGNNIVYDQTRHLSRGRDDIAGYSDIGGFAGRTPEIRGQGIWLEPGKNNRLYMLYEAVKNGSGTPRLSPISSDPSSASGRSETYAGVSGNIVPRSLGLRDE
jgi:hypothetical protein